MSHTVAVERAGERLADLVAGLGPGDEIVLTRDGRPVARIVPAGRPARARRPGSCKGMLTIVEDDDAYLAGFAEYVP